MATSVDSTADVITDDLPCANCGYNLRTLAIAGRHPECGVAGKQERQSAR